MEHSELSALSPLDGRYYEKCQQLRPYFSEYGLIRYRVLVELLWFKHLVIKERLLEADLSEQTIARLDQLIHDFSENDARQVKQLEAITLHDIKAVEYFLKDYFNQHDELKPLTELVHFGCTSEDINNIAYALMLKDARKEVLNPLLEQVDHAITAMALAYNDCAMISRTHGQVATPTTLGKEMANFVARIRTARRELNEIRLLAKMNGAVGNFNAHTVAFGELDWMAVTKDFIESLDLVQNRYTTQIEPHDYIAAFLHQMSRINTILLDFSRDMWSYISINYFKQKSAPGQVGSSTMPHKVNPIKFENAEGNLGMANAINNFLAEKLPVSRWQRDLSDSTSLRNIGVALGHSVTAYESLLKGLAVLDINQQALHDDLNQNWVVLAEAIQTVMRRYGEANPYERLKSFTQNFNQQRAVSQNDIQQFIHELDIPEEAKQALQQLSPERYIGVAHKLAMDVENYHG